MNLEENEFQWELSNLRLLSELQLLKFILVQMEPHKADDMRTLAGLSHKNLRGPVSHLLGSLQLPTWQGTEVQSCYEQEAARIEWTLDWEHIIAYQVIKKLLCD